MMVTLWGSGLSGSATPDSLPDPWLPVVLPVLGKNRDFLREREIILRTASSPFVLCLR